MLYFCNIYWNQKVEPNTGEMGPLDNKVEGEKWIPVQAGEKEEREKDAFNRGENNQSSVATLKIILSYLFKTQQNTNNVKVRMFLKVKISLFLCKSWNLAEILSQSSKCSSANFFFLRRVPKNVKQNLKYYFIKMAFYLHKQMKKNSIHIILKVFENSDQWN